jgi:hypothetical protein
MGPNISPVAKIRGWEPNRVKYLTIKLEFEQTKNDAAEHPN